MSVETQKIQDAVELGQSAVKKAVKSGSENYTKAINATQEQSQKATAQLLGGLDEVATMQKKGSEITSRFVEDLHTNVEEKGREAVEYAQRSAEKNMKAIKDTLAAKSLQDAVEVQVDYANEAYRDLMQEVTKAASGSAEMMQKFSEPVQGYVKEVASRAAKSLNVK